MLNRNSKYQSSEDQDKNDSNQSILVFNKQNSEIIAVNRVTRVQALMLANTIWPGNTTEQPPGQITISFSYSSNSWNYLGGYEPAAYTLQNSTKCGAQDIKKHQKEILKNFGFKAVEMDYSQSLFNREYYIEHLIPNFDKIGVVHVVKIAATIQKTIDLLNEFNLEMPPMTMVSGVDQLFKTGKERITVNNGRPADYAQNILKFLKKNEWKRIGVYAEEVPDLKQISDQI